MIHKLTKSGNGVLTIDDDGRAYMTSTKFLMSLLMGNLKAGFILTSRMPFNVNPDRFQKSKLWIPNDMDEKYVKEQLDRQEVRGNKNNTDALSGKMAKENKQAKIYSEDKW